MPMFEARRCSHRNQQCALARQGLSEVHTDMCPRESAQEDLNWAEEWLEKALADARAAGLEASAEVEKCTIRVEKARAKLARLHA
jgi:hypothetical protein